MTSTEWVTIAVAGGSALIAHLLAQRSYIKSLFHERIVKIEDRLDNQEEITGKLQLDVAVIKKQCRILHGSSALEDSTDPVKPLHASQLKRHPA